MPRDDGSDDDDHDFSLTNWRLKQLERGRTEADLRLDKLEAWKNWVLGIGTAVGLTVGAFAKQVWNYLSGHP
jgi:hypothetical protein